MENIILYGVPGSGKTSLAEILSDILKLPHWEADEMRKIGQWGRSPESDPFFFLPTTEAYQAIGPRIPENVIRGLVGVRNAYKDLVAKEIASYKDGYVVEAAFLDPASLKDNGAVMLITVPSEEKHRGQFLVHRTEDAFTNGQFENARIIHEFLMQEAKELNIPVLENDGDLNSLAEKSQKVIGLF